jgi:hypothetical protein
MSNDSRAHRRRALVAAVGNLLDATQLELALNDVDNNMRGDNVSDVIACIDGIAGRGLLDSGLTKRLYGEFFKALQQPDSSLPADPWANRGRAPAAVSGVVSAAPRAPTLPARPAVSAAPAAPVAPPVVAAQPAPVAPPAPKTATVAPAAASAKVAALAAVTLTPEQAVFAALQQEIRQQMLQNHVADLPELDREIPRQLKRERIEPLLGEKFLGAWHNSQLPNAWKLEIGSDDFVMLLHIVYLALCEVLGPVAADSVLAQAVQAAERLPEAAKHSPKLFL